MPTRSTRGIPRRTGRKEPTTGTRENFRRGRGRPKPTTGSRDSYGKRKEPSTGTK